MTQRTSESRKQQVGGEAKKKKEDKRSALKLLLAIEVLHKRCLLSLGPNHRDDGGEQGRRAFGKGLSIQLKTSPLSLVRISGNHKAALGQLLPILLDKNRIVLRPSGPQKMRKVPKTRKTRSIGSTDFRDWPLYPKENPKNCPTKASGTQECFNKHSNPEFFDSTTSEDNPHQWIDEEVTPSRRKKGVILFSSDKFGVDKGFLTLANESSGIAQHSQIRRALRRLGFLRFGTLRTTIVSY